MAPTVTGNLQLVERKFESNLSRLFAKKEGESDRKRYIIAIASFVPALFSDIVRFALFKAKLINGKSFSLIDKASAGTQALSNKVSAVWENYKNPSFAVKNERSEAVLKAKVKTLANAYSDSYFFGLITKDSFTSKDEGKIQKAKNSLLNAMTDHLKLHYINSDHFASQSAAVKELVEKFIVEEAGDKFYIATKTVREPNAPRHLLANVIKDELTTEFNATQGARFESVTTAPSFISALATQVANGQLSKEQAQKAIGKRLPEIYNRTLTTAGMKEADKVVEDMVNEAVSKELITQDQANSLKSAAKGNATVEEFALGTAIDIVENIPAPTTTDSVAEIDHITDTAKKLAKEGKIKENQTSVLCTTARKKVTKIRDKKAAEARAKKAAEAKAYKAQQAKEAVIAKKIAAEAAEQEARVKAEAAEQEAQVKAEAVKLEAQIKTKENTGLFNKLKALLEIVFHRNEERSKTIEACAEKRKELIALAAEIESLNEKTITLKIDGSEQEVSMIQALAIYQDKVTKLSKISNPEEREKASQGIKDNAEVIQWIIDFQQKKMKQDILIQEEEQLWSEAKESHKTYSRCLNIYNDFKATMSVKAFESMQQEYLKGVELTMAQSKKESDQIAPKGLPNAFKDDKALLKQEDLSQIVDQLILENHKVISTDQQPSSAVEDKTAQLTPPFIEVVKEAESQNQSSVADFEVESEAVPKEQSSYIVGLTGYADSSRPKAQPSLWHSLLHRVGLVR